MQPLLRLCQSRSIGRVVGVARIPIKSTSFTQPQAILYRCQHNSFGPHKEYFQTPGNEPKPDVSPYVRERQQRPSTRSQSQSDVSKPSQNYGQAAAEQELHVNPRGWLRVPRIIRSAIWFFTFLQLGFVAGTALITWDYLSPPFEPGSPEEQELVEEVLEMLETNPMVAGLRENGWSEVAPFTPDLQHGLKGRNMVHQILGGNSTQGIFMKVFHHPTMEYTMLVFFLGFGVEGWPDVIHGGIIATMLQEGLSKHISRYYPGHYTTANSTTNIDFRKPCKPGEIYGVLVAPSGAKTVSAGNIQLQELETTALLVQIEGAPTVSTSFDYNLNIHTHTIGIPAQAGRQPTHATCLSHVRLVPKKLNQDITKLQIGGKDNPGFDKALDFLKTMPQFKGSPTSDQAGEQTSERKDND